jgi:hypothetical protein
MREEPDQNSRDAEILSEASAKSDAGEEIRSDRRRLLIAGLIAAPFMLTLASRPARAASAMGSMGCYDYGVDDGSDDDSSVDGRLDNRDNRPRDRGRKPGHSQFDN